MLRRYGQWAGSPNGSPEDVTLCIEEVYPAGRSIIPAQCRRKRGHGKDGLYCKQHARMQERKLTKHAPDVVESATSVSIFPTSEVSASEAESKPATTQVM